MKFTPRPYQQDIIDHVAGNTSAFVLAQMGAGKTSALLQSLKQVKPNRVLIIAPLRVAKHTWPDEIKKWDNFAKYTYAVAVGTPKQRTAAVEGSARIVIINQENVTWLIDKMWSKLNFDMVVIDESSAFKSASSKRFKALKKLRTKKPISRWVLMTATPTPNSLMEAWSQMFLLDGGKRLGTAFYNFRNRYFNSDYMGFKWELKPGAGKKIRDKIAELAVVVERYDGLPDRVDLTERVYLPPKVRNEYEQLSKDFLLELQDSDITAVNAAVLVGKLQQLASGAVYRDDKEYEIYHNAKLDALQSLVDQAEGENLLVAYSYRHEYERIKAIYPHAVSIKDPDVIGRWNRGEIKMLLAHPASAAHGLNLQDGGRRIIWYSPTWSNEMKLQFDARLHRQGQKDHVYVHTICADSTIDDEIVKAVAGKKSAQDILLAAVKKYREKI